MDNLVILKDLSGISKDFSQIGLNEKDLMPGPIEQFILWIEDAIANASDEPNAMVLSTVSTDNKPSSRVVLLKYITDRGFVFFTNYESVKGKHLKDNPNVSALFYWPSLERQVRVDGKIEKVSAEFSDFYFNSRQTDSQLGAVVSQQSEVIPTREYLLEKMDELRQSFKGKKLVRPYYWGGYIVLPEQIEFWQGRPNRLSDRLRYRIVNDKWVVERLAP